MKASLALAIAACAPLLCVAPNGQAAERRLVVATHEAPPFSMQRPDGRWEGISIELWREIAEDLELDFDFVPVDLESQIEALQEGRVDVVVGALTVTSARDQLIDYSHPYESSGLGIAVRGESGENTLFTALSRLASLEFLSALAALAGVLLGAGALVWVFERRRNAGQFGGSVAHGLGSGFWWSAVTMTTVGYGDKAPVTPGGRIVALVWMFTSIVVISSFTAAIASSLTVDSLRYEIDGPEDLPGKRVASVEGSTSVAYLTKVNAEVAFFEEPALALEALADGSIDAAVYDAPILRHLALHSGRQVHVVPRTFARQDYAFGLPAGSSLREPINHSLLAHIARPGWQRRLAYYLGE